MSNVNTTPAPRKARNRVGADIHPEIPMPEWVEERYSDDDGRVVVDETDYIDGIFCLTRCQSHTLEDDGSWFTHDEHAFLRWRTAWPSEPNVRLETEEFTILPKDAPALVAVLQRFHEAAKA